jgi:hypothetical protein
MIHALLSAVAHEIPRYQQSGDGIPTAHLLDFCCHGNWAN